MADSLNVSPDRLRTAADHLTDVSDRMKTILSSLNGQAESLGQPWGDDDTGHQFADGDDGYLARKDMVGRAADSAAAFLEELADNIRTAANTFEQQDSVT